MKQKTLREDAHSREAETCRKRPRETPECAKAHSFRHIGKGCIKIEKGGILIWNETRLHTKRSIRRW